MNLSVIRPRSAVVGGLGGLRPYRSFLFLSLLVALFAMAYGQLLAEFVVWQQKRPHYHASLFPLLAFCLLLGWRSLGSQARDHVLLRGKQTFGFLAVSWVLLTLAVILPSPLMACLSAIMLAGAGCSELGTRREVTNLWGIWSLLWLVVPIPLGQDQVLIAKLQLWSSQLCSLGLDRLGVLHLMEGNKLSLAGGELFVDEACSGIVSVLLVVSLASIYGIARDRPTLHVLLLATSGVAWATLLNAVRIGTIAIALDWYALDWSAGWAHEMVGALTALLAIAATVATDQSLCALLAPIEHEYEAATAKPIGVGRTLAKTWDRLVQVGPHPAGGQSVAARSGFERPQTPLRADVTLPRLLCGLVPFALVGGIGWALPKSGQSVATDSSTQVERALAIDADTLPRELASATLAHYHRQRRDTGHQFGDYSSIFEYRAEDGTQFVVSCDFPFPAGWHELSVCYQGVGWELLSRDIVATAEASGHVEAHFRIPDKGRAAVLYSAFGSHGEVIEPPSATLAGAVRRALARRRSQSGNEQVFQVQVLVTWNGTQPLSEDRLETARQMLVEAERKFKDSILSSPDSPSP